MRGNPVSVPNFGSVLLMGAVVPQALGAALSVSMRLLLPVIGIGVPFTKLKQSPPLTLLARMVFFRVTTANLTGESFSC